MKKSGRCFDKISSMTIYIYKIGEMNGSSYVKIPLRSSVEINFQNDDRYCFLWSIIAHIHPMAESKIGHATRVSNYSFAFEVWI